MELKLPSSDMEFTANIFYHLLLDSMKNRNLPGDNYKGSNGKLTQTHLFYDLNVLTNTLEVDIGNFRGLLYGEKIQGSQKNAAKKFKYGEFTAVKSAIYLFNDAEIVAEFDSQVRNEYSKVFLKAVEFAHRYFDNKSPRNDILVKKVLYLILNDDSIDESQEFYICTDGSTKTKSDLKSINEIEFEAFLLGIWHYLIISQRLQADLKDVEKIKVDSNYKQLNVNLTYSNINTAPKCQKSLGSVSKKSTKINSAFISEDHNKGKCICEAQMGYYPSEIDKKINIISILENNDITLSRSIFFYLLAGAVEPVHPKRGKNAVEKLFLDMLNLTVDDDCNIDFSQSLVRYHHDKFRYLKEISSADFLDDESKINVFSDKICNNYDEALRSMIKIRQKYFNSEEKNQTLVIALIEFIRNDNSIDDDHEFIVCSDGSALTKKQLCEIEEIEFEPFILGIWHYVISQLTAKDSADKLTFDTVFKLSYTHNGKNCERYQSGDIIEQQSDMYVELIYLEE